MTMLCSPVVLLTFVVQAIGGALAYVLIPMAHFITGGVCGIVPELMQKRVYATDAGVTC